MTLRIDLQQVVEDKDNPGQYVVTVRALRDLRDVNGDVIPGAGDVLGKKNVTVTSAAELKAKIKPVFESLVAEEQQRESMRVIAQGVIDEIMNEVVQ